MDSQYIEGVIGYLFISKINGLNSLILNLDSALTPDSVSLPANGFSFNNNELKINFADTYMLGDTISFAVHYHGNPPLAGGYKGLRYEMHDGTEPVIASLSTPYLAHSWWPCKDGVHDKADSTYIDITIKDTIINELPLIAVSNGLLDTVEINDGKKTFKWKHYYPIVPYYIMVAVSNYDHFQQIITGSNYSFPIDYYVFKSHLADAKVGVAQLPDAMNFFSKIFGTYPFAKEKYGMTQLGYYGAIENQTNTITNNMGQAWFYTSVHELAHQWFADMITCKTWNHGWLNEGFATYSEALYAEHRGGINSYHNYVDGFKYKSDGTLYLYDVSNPFTGVFQSIIYNKGAYVLHMLRGVLGDSAFFDLIYSYANNPNFRYKNVTTEDFQMVCENISGINLDYFFTQWVYDAYFPIYNYNFFSNKNTGNLDISIKQTQSDFGRRSVFEMPMDIKIEFDDFTDTIVRVYNDIQFQTFSFNLQKPVSNIIIDPSNWILKTALLDQNIGINSTDNLYEIFTIFPNPANNNLQIRTESIKGEFEVLIYDINGNLKLKKTFLSTRNGLYNLNLVELSSGIYIVEIRTNNGRFIEKIECD